MSKMDIYSQYISRQQHLSENSLISGQKIISERDVLINRLMAEGFTSKQIDNLLNNYEINEIAPLIAGMVARGAVSAATRSLVSGATRSLVSGAGGPTAAGRLAGTVAGNLAGPVAGRLAGRTVRRAVSGNGNKEEEDKSISETEIVINRLMAEGYTAEQIELIIENSSVGLDDVKYYTSRVAAAGRNLNKSLLAGSGLNPLKTIGAGKDLIRSSRNVGRARKVREAKLGNNRNRSLQIQPQSSDTAQQNTTKTNADITGQARRSEGSAAAQQNTTKTNADITGQARRPEGSAAAQPNGKGFSGTPERASQRNGKENPFSKPPIDPRIKDSVITTSNQGTSAATPRAKPAATGNKSAPDSKPAGLGRGRVVDSEGHLTPRGQQYVAGKEAEEEAIARKAGRLPWAEKAFYGNN